MLHCVYASSGKKNKNKKTLTTTKKTKVIKEPDAKCIYLFIHSVPSPSSRLQHGEKKAVREAEGGVTGQKKNKNYYKRWWGVMAVKHTLVHMAFLPLFITHTYCLCTEVLQVCFMCPRPPVQVQRQSPKKVDTKGQKIKGGSPRLSGMTKIKAFKKEGLKEEERKKRSGTHQLCSPAFLLHLWNGDEISERENKK